MQREYSENVEVERLVRRIGALPFIPPVHVADAVAVLRQSIEESQLDPSVVEKLVTVLEYFE